MARELYAVAIGAATLLQHAALTLQA